MSSVSTHFDEFGFERSHLVPLDNPLGKNIRGEGIFQKGTSHRQGRRFKKRVLKKSRHQSQVKPLLKTSNFRGFGE